MRRAKLPITTLPAWAKINDISLLDVHVQDLGNARGFGITTERALNSVEETFDLPVVLIVPRESILSREAVDEFIKVDSHFRELVGVAGGKSLRGDVLLFLLMQMTISAEGAEGRNVGVSNPWTEYVKMLPAYVPVPTMWNEEERSALVGTSLEDAVSAKLTSLRKEYDDLRTLTFDIAWCRACWWEEELLEFGDWILIDAWFRSRSLEIPDTGESMVPALDMVNHSAKPNAYYELGPDGQVVLLLHPGIGLGRDSEITISYGFSKSAAEMLFSYGFIDKGSVTSSLTLNLEPFPDDPLGRAKFAAFLGPPVVRLIARDEDLEWQSPFVYFLCLNQEDGLDFKVMEQTDGSRSHLRTYWQGVDITDQTDSLEQLVQDHRLKQVFTLRAVAFLESRMQEQLTRLEETQAYHNPTAEAAGGMESDRYGSAMQLREHEISILRRALYEIGLQKHELLKDHVVLQYLGLMEEADEPKHADMSTSNEDDDFS